jgi:hypothetical protein
MAQQRFIDLFLLEGVVSAPEKFRKTLRREHAESMRRGARELNRDRPAKTTFQIGVDLKILLPAAN